MFFGKLDIRHINHIWIMIVSSFHLPIRHTLVVLGSVGLVTGTFRIWLRGSWTGRAIQRRLSGRKQKLEKCWSRSSCLTESCQGLIETHFMDHVRENVLGSCGTILQSAVCFRQWPISPIFSVDIWIIFRIFWSGDQGIEVEVTFTNYMLCFY